MNEQVEIKKNFGIVFLSGVLTVLITNLTSIMIPLFTTYEVYAGYKVYSVYITYSGLFHLGFINGMYLKYGKCLYSELPALKMRSYFRLLLFMQIIFAAINVYLIKIFDITEIAYLFVAINVPLININCYFTLINQFTKRFKLDALIQLIQNVIMVGVVVLSYKGYFEQYSYLLVAITTINCVACVLQLCVSRQIVFGKSEAVKAIGNEIKEMFSEGKWVMFSELVGIALLNVDLIFVQRFFGITEFAFYSFAASTISAIYALIIYVNNIAYPYLVRSNNLNDVSKKVYNLIIKLGIIIMPTYYLIAYLMREYLKKYYPSVEIIRILYLTIIFKMLVVCFYGNMCKVNKTNATYLKINVVVLIISIALNAIAIVVLNNYQGVAVATVVSMVLWWLFLEKRMSEKIHIKNIIRLMGACISFVVIPENNFLIAMFVYLLVNMMVYIFADKLKSNEG